MAVTTNTERPTTRPLVTLRAKDVGPTDPDVRKARYIGMYKEGGKQLRESEVDAVFTLLSGYDSRVAGALHDNFLVEAGEGVYGIKPGANAVEDWLNEVRVSTREAHEGGLIGDGTLQDLLNELNVTSALYRIEQLTEKDK